MRHMNMIRNLLLVSTLFSFSSCIFLVSNSEKKDSIVTTDSLQARTVRADTIDSPAIKPVDSIGTTPAVKEFFSGKKIETKSVQPQQVVDYAKTLIGVPYKYASADPKTGFDCSGFITHVFNHFGIIVPRSSIDFTEVGKTVAVGEARAGDLILFTGTDSTEKFVGHMGLVVTNNQGKLEFIHSTSGKKYGVTISPLSGYYESRFVKTIRIF